MSLSSTLAKISIIGVVRNANEFEKIAALNFAINVKNHERKAKSLLHYPQDMGGETEANFWKALGGTKNDVRPA